MPPLEPFAYAVLRVVPDAARGEAVNAGVVLFCRGRRYLKLLAAAPEVKLRALNPAFDLEALRGHLRILEAVAAGDGAGGPVASGEQSARFHWLVAPSSTMVQPSEVHTGLCADPEEQTRRLFGQLVL
ncbi:MAG: DUF3037 domain-containing protein [Candidatus Dormibacteria bacterium]